LKNKLIKIKVGNGPGETFEFEKRRGNTTTEIRHIPSRIAGYGRNFGKE
jgi:hypothetical protein